MTEALCPQISALRVQWLRHLWAIGICLLISGCASLPDVRYLNTSLDAQGSPTVKTASGALPDKKAESLLAKRLRGDKIDVPRLAALEEAATGSPLIAGNELTLLIDGPQTMEAMMAAIRAAKDHVNLETYIFGNEGLGKEFADLLIEKQKEGVQVNVIYDSVGSMKTPTEFFNRLRDAGVALVEFNPINPFARFGRWKLNNRDHRKILVVDGKIAFTGGINITNEYSSGSLFGARSKNKTDLGWRDTHIRVEGPAVASFQWLFMQTWASQRNDDLTQRNYFPPLTAVGNKIVRVIASEPGSDYEVYKAYVLAMQEAKKTIHITNSYFVPDTQMIEALTGAAKRGVDVKLIFPGMSDASLVMYAGRSFYSELLAAGVRIFELQASVLHAKTAVIDGYWSTVGSTNLDMRSFLHNTEVNLIALDQAFGSIMEDAFQEDLRNSIEVLPEEWANRPSSDRLREWFARRFEYWL
ncbi:cardiolipin synthase [Oxalicibacterium faecigallinarum]|uniref:Cardiolipin synthase n=1 Tax=Oxalicibacterium faecigallinarum TaxID=573741 RepID=A0A8J3AUU6_9BURK|nr:cardiolipin synthase [Oxalicibacterium faecigallinarum]GGI17282.1 cardiolipin synthase B [Oxalicibacterium faecigallinarum]